MPSTILEKKVQLFTCRQFGENVTNLVINAHAGVEDEEQRSLFQKWFGRSYGFATPVWTTLYFYTPHGTAMKSDLLSLMSGEYPPFEAFLPGESVVDYDLAHYSAGYLTVSDEKIEEYILESRLTGDPVTKFHPFRVYDVATVKPCGDRYSTLKEVIDVLFRCGYHYPRIHLKLCRYIYGTSVDEAICKPGYHLLYGKPK